MVGPWEPAGEGRPPAAPDPEREELAPHRREKGAYRRAGALTNLGGSGAGKGAEVYFLPVFTS